jgi:hypothetical protein
MAEIHGNQGAIFYRSGYLADDGIAFVDSNPDTLTHDLNGFVTAGFVAGDTISISGSTSNDGEYTIDAGGVAAGTITLIAGDSLTAEIAGDDVIMQTVPGTQMGGFFNWSINWDSEVHDVTDFADGTARTFMSGLTTWTATAERFWLTGGATADTEPQPGDTHYLRFFVVYTATPNVTTNYYYEGSAICTACNPTVPVGEIVKGTISWQGSSTLLWTSRAIAWG